MSLLGYDTTELPDFFVTSDTHFFHKSIVEYAGRPHDHDRLMIENWNNTVTPYDRVLHLGDLVFGSTRRFDTIQLNGTKYILRGNHDHKKIGWYHKRGFTVEDRQPRIEYRGWTIVFSHYPNPRLVKRLGRCINVHGHIHEKVLSDRRLINVCVEQTNYKPVFVKDILDERIKELDQAWQVIEQPVLQS